MQQLSHPFPPVVDVNCRILILGSFPSVKSREQGFFYGHPQNRFWRLLASIFDEPTPADVPSRQAMLLRHHIALWDVIASCSIEGSSDASIRDAVPVDIDLILRSSSIERVICNGTLAGKLYRKYLLPITGIEPLVLPSTSPANASFSLERLTGIWANALNA